MAILHEPHLDVRLAASRLDTLRRRARDMALAAGLVATTGGVLLGLGRGAAGFACLIAAAFGLGVAGLARGDRSRLLTRLVAEGLDGANQDTRAWAGALVTRARRVRLAKGLERAADAGRPGVHDYVHIRPDRAHAIRDDLLRIASAFRDQARPLAPRSAALCERMLCEAIVSPLYNPQLPETDLVDLLREIESGVG